MKTKLILFTMITLTLLTLSGCGNNEDTANPATPDPGKITYETENYFIFVPEDWRILERSDLPSDAPAEFQVAFKNNIKNDVFTASVGITKDTFLSTKTSEDFMINSKTEIEKAIIGYEEISAEGNTLIFEGKKSATDPIIRFKTIYIINGNDGYTITAAYLPTEDESVVNMTDEMLNSFSLK